MESPWGYGSHGALFPPSLNGPWGWQGHPIPVTSNPIAKSPVYTNFPAVNPKTGMRYNFGGYVPLHYGLAELTPGGNTINFGTRRSRAKSRRTRRTRRTRR